MMRLALAFLKIGLASFGGGWTIVGIIQTEIVGRGWLSAGEFSRVVALAQITPGPVALNAATLVGYKLYGLAGSVLATLSVVAAPVILSLVVSTLLKRASAKGDRLSESLKTGTIGLVVMTVWTFAPSAAASWGTAAIAALSFVIAAFTKINPVWVILGSGLAGALARVFLGA